MHMGIGIGIGVRIRLAVGIDTFIAIQRYNIGAAMSSICPGSAATARP
jgi:hypothetical protein